MGTIMAEYYFRSFTMNGNREGVFVESCLLLKLFGRVDNGRSRILRENGKRDAKNK